MGFLTDWFNKGELPQNFWEDSASGWHFQALLVIDFGKV